MQAKKIDKRSKSLSLSIERVDSTNIYQYKRYCVSSYMPACAQFQNQLRQTRETRIQAQKINKQRKYLSFKKVGRLDYYISGQALLCPCLPACWCSVLYQTKIDFQSYDIGSKNRQEKQFSIFLWRQQTRLIYRLVK